MEIWRVQYLSLREERAICDVYCCVKVEAVLQTGNQRLSRCETRRSGTKIT